MYHGICAYLMNSTIDVTVAFVVYAKTLRTFCLARRVRVACQVRAKTRHSKIRGRKCSEGTEDCFETSQHRTVSVSDCFQRIFFNLNMYKAKKKET